MSKDSKPELISSLKHLTQSVYLFYMILTDIKSEDIVKLRKSLEEWAGKHEYDFSKFAPKNMNNCYSDKFFVDDFLADASLKEIVNTHKVGFNKHNALDMFEIIQMCLNTNFRATQDYKTGEKITYSFSQEHCRLVVELAMLIDYTKILRKFLMNDTYRLEDMEFGAQYKSLHTKTELSSFLDSYEKLSSSRGCDHHFKAFKTIKEEFKAMQGIKNTNERIEAFYKISQAILKEIPKFPLFSCISINDLQELYGDEMLEAPAKNAAKDFNADQLWEKVQLYWENNGVNYQKLFPNTQKNTESLLTPNDHKEETQNFSKSVDSVNATISQIKSDESFKSQSKRVYENVHDRDRDRDLKKNEVSFKSGDWYEILEQCAPIKLGKQEDIFNSTDSNIEDLKHSNVKPRKQEKAVEDMNKSTDSNIEDLNGSSANTDHVEIEKEIVFKQNILYSSSSSDSTNSFLRLDEQPFDEQISMSDSLDDPIIDDAKSPVSSVIINAILDSISKITLYQENVGLKK